MTAALQALEERLARLERRIGAGLPPADSLGEQSAGTGGTAAADALAASILRVTPEGKIEERLSGHLQAAGVELEAPEQAGEDTSVIWRGASAVAGEINGTLGADEARRLTIKGGSGAELELSSRQEPAGGKLLQTVAAEVSEASTGLVLLRSSRTPPGAAVAESEVLALGAPTPDYQVRVGTHTFSNLSTVQSAMIETGLAELTWAVVTLSQGLTARAGFSFEGGGGKLTVQAESSVSMPTAYLFWLVIGRG